MTPQVSYFIPGSIEDTDRHIGVSDGNHITDKQKGNVPIIMCDDKVDTFIAPLHKILIAQIKCDGLFSIIKFRNSVHTCLFHKGLCMVYFGKRRKMRLHYHIVNSRNMLFGGK